MERVKEIEGVASTRHPLDAEMFHALPGVDRPLQPVRHGAAAIPALPVRVAIAHRTRRWGRRGLGKAAGGPQVGQRQAVLEGRPGFANI